MILRIGKNNRGFLLIEVIISVSILSIGMVLILNSFIRSIRAKELSEDYFKAALLIEEKMYEVVDNRFTEGSDGGVFTDFGNRFAWDLNVMEIEDGLRELNLEVSWKHGISEKSIGILTYLYLPAL